MSFIKVAFFAYVCATLAAIVAALAKSTTVSAANCDATFGAFFPILCAFVAVAFVLIAQFIALSYIKCCGDLYLTRTEKIRNMALFCTLAPFIAACALLYYGLKYKKQMDDGGGGSLSSTCVISHPAYLYIAAALCAVHCVIFLLSVNCGEDVTDDQSNGGVEMT